MRMLAAALAMVFANLLANLAFASDDLSRTWESADGKFTVNATLVQQTSTHVILRKENDSEIQVPLTRLSDADRAYLQNAPQGDSSTQVATLRTIATSFFNGLRTEDRKESRDQLTDQGRKLVDEKTSPLAQLPKPDNGVSSIRIGKVVLDGKQATVPAVIMTGGELVRTRLQMVEVNQGDWRVASISAKVGKNDLTIPFETAIAIPPVKPEDPLLGLVGKPIEVTGITLNGQSVSLNDYRGKVVLIEFWATWCGACRAEIPNLLKNHEAYHASGFEVLAVSLDADMEQLTEFVASQNPPWTVLADAHPNNPRSMRAAFQLRSIPATILVGRDGKVLEVNCGGERLGNALKAAM